MVPVVDLQARQQHVEVVGGRIEIDFMRQPIDQLVDIRAVALDHLVGILFDMAHVFIRRRSGENGLHQLITSSAEIMRGPADCGCRRALHKSCA